MSARKGAAARLAAWSLPLVVLPAKVLACPVCFSAKDEANRVAFFVSTVFLTALPLLLLGAFISWVARRARMLDRESAAAEPGAESGRVIALASRMPGESDRAV